MKGIGIDTGGMCTDAVIYDFDSGTVAASAKTLTTHHDLKIGIAEVEIRPVTGDNYGDALVVAQDTRQVFSSRAKALSFARKEGRRIVREKALAQGAADELEIREERVRNEAPMGYGTIWLGDTLRFTASDTIM